MIETQRHGVEAAETAGGQRLRGLAAGSVLAFGLVAGFVGWPGGAQSASGTAGAAVVGAGTTLQPYRAVYDLRLDRSRASSSVNGVEGAITFSWEQFCGGSITEHRAVMTIDTARGSNEVAWTFQAWETDGGEEYRATIRRFQDGAEVENLRVQARHDAEGTGGVARLVPQGEQARREEGPSGQQAGEELRLPAGTLFPTHYVRALIEGLRDEEPVQFHQVFDGSGDAQGLYGASAVLIETPSREAEPEVDSDLFADQRSWRIQLAYFEDDGSGDGQENLPAHEQSFRLYENGIVSELTLDYGSFALDARLSRLEALEMPDCGP